MAILMENSMVRLMLEREAVFLENEVAPGVTSPALAQKARMSGQLLRLAALWVEQRQEAAQENQAMKQVLKKIVDTLRNEKSLSRDRTRNGLIRGLRSKLKETLSADEGSNNRELRAALSEAIEGLDALSGRLSEETMISLKKEIHSVIRLQLDNTLEGIKRVGVTPR